MSPEERKEDLYLLDVKALLLVENAPRVVENPKDAVNFGNRIQVPFKEEDFVDLKTWHPLLPDEYCPTI